MLYGKYIEELFVIVYSFVYIYLRRFSFKIYLLRRFSLNVVGQFEILQGPAAGQCDQYSEEESGEMGNGGTGVLTQCHSSAREFGFHLKGNE